MGFSVMRAKGLAWNGRPRRDEVSSLLKGKPPMVFLYSSSSFVFFFIFWKDSSGAHNCEWPCAQELRDGSPATFLHRT